MLCIWHEMVLKTMFLGILKMKILVKNFEHYISLSLLGHWALLNLTVWCMGKSPFLEYSILNLFNILSEYVHWLKHSNRSYMFLYILIPSIYVDYPRSFIAKHFPSQDLTSCTVGTLFPSRSISSTYKTRKVTTF